MRQFDGQLRTAARLLVTGALLTLAACTAPIDLGSSHGTDLTGRTCSPTSKCGPELGQANHLCSDGTTTAGPSGRCLEHTDGSCTWEVIDCPTAGGCAYNGQNYSPGQSFPAMDGCNTCSCESGGGVACTLLGCVTPCTYNGQSYSTGDTFPSTDGCNTCSCQDDGSVVCTKQACAAGCDYNGQTHQAGDSFPSSDGCNTCSCETNGQVLCTQRACAALTWFATCGPPVCGPTPPTPDPNVLPCTADEMAGLACPTAGAQCDPGNPCGGNLECATTDPTNGGQCPISRAKYKEQITYLDDTEVEKYARELLQINLTTYRYKQAPSGDPRHLGFIIDDVGASASVNPDGESVNLYGYTSMAVAAIQTQAKQIDTLRKEIAELRSLIATKTARK